MILPLRCHPGICQLTGTEAVGARGCIRLCLMPLMALSSMNSSNPFLNLFIYLLSEHPVATGFALYFCFVWKCTSFALFKSRASLLYWIFLTSFIKTTDCFDFLQAIPDFINLSSLLPASFPGWEVYLLAPCIKSIKKLGLLLSSPSSS